MVAVLVQHAADGRLTFAELEGRIDEVHRARYLDELGAALRELPVLRAAEVGPEPLRPEGTLRSRLRPLAGIALAAGIFLAIIVPGAPTRYIDTGEASATTDRSGGSVPEPLPLPGLGQPADPTLARIEVVRAYVEAFEPDQEPAAKESAVVRTPGMAAAGQAVVDRYPEAVATTTVHVGPIVFTSPTEATLRFELRYSGGAPFGVRNGTAVWDGRWKVSSQTFCSVLAYGGGIC